MSNSRVVPSMKVLTQSKPSSADIEISTGSGTLEGSPMSATSSACHSPASFSKISQIFEVRAVVVKQ